MKKSKFYRLILLYTLLVLIPLTFLTVMMFYHRYIIPGLLSGAVELYFILRLYNFIVENKDSLL